MGNFEVAHSQLVAPIEVLIVASPLGFTMIEIFLSLKNCHDAIIPEVIIDVATTNSMHSIIIYWDR